GVGKTHVAKVLAEFLFGDEDEIIRIDCSEYSLDHEYAKLIGAPPGYIGHKEGGFLTEAVKEKPRSVILFDEIEKAHWKVHNLLLQMFDAGHLTDNKGTKISFRNTVIIMTSNVGVRGIQDISGAIGFGDHEGKVDHDIKTQEMIKSLRKTFKPEFINRIDEVVNFHSLTRDHNIQIIDIMLTELIDRLKQIGMDIDIPKEVKEFLVDRGTDEKMGARPLRRAIHRFIESPLSEDILRKVFVEGDFIKTAPDGDTIAFTKKKSKKGSGKKTLEDEEGSGDVSEPDEGEPEDSGSGKDKKTKKSGRKKVK
ncbi:MAG: AAA family ATPase, partial [bacterium]|nr:AAA family ATPase [bacterium]